MGEISNIDWTDATWNPWRGCHKCSEGCKFCYMFRDQKRYGKDPNTVVLASPQTFNMPLKLKPGTKVFTCSWSDFFIEEADAWRPFAWGIIRSRPDLTFQILTKRPERIMQCLPRDWGNGWPHVWLVVSTENQEAANERIPILLQVPAVVRGVSAGPLIGPVNMWRWVCGICRHAKGACSRHQKQDGGNIDWVAIECESGPDHRGWDAYEQNARNIIKQCEAAGVAAFHKQMPINGRVSHNPNEWPEDLRVRQWPTNTQETR